MPVENDQEGEGASGYSQPPSLIGVIRFPVEWLKTIHSAGEEGESGDEISRRDPQAGLFGNEGIINRRDARQQVKVSFAEAEVFFLSCGHRCATD